MAPKPGDNPLDRRDHFLLAMYAELWQNINRHIIILWEGVAVLVAFFAVYGLVERQVIPLAVASMILVLAAAWVVAHTYDSSHWYNRNLLIISNIERQFLTRTDLKDIHYFFGEHRRRGEMIMFLRIQWALAIGVAGLVILFYTATIAIPAVMRPPTPTLEQTIGLLSPYLVALAAFLFTEVVRKKRNQAYQALLDRSPGIPLK